MSDDNAADIEGYVDARELLPGYKRVPCKECDESVYAKKRFDPDEWWCPAHLPSRIDMDHLRDPVEVGL